MISACKARSAGGLRSELRRCARCLKRLCQMSPRGIRRGFALDHQDRGVHWFVCYYSQYILTHHHPRTLALLLPALPYGLFQLIPHSIDLVTLVSIAGTACHPSHLTALAPSLLDPHHLPYSYPTSTRNNRGPAHSSSPLFLLVPLGHPVWQ